MIPAVRPSRLAVGLGLVLAASLALAEPKHDKGDKHGGHPAAQAGGHDRHAGPSIDVGRVRLVIGEHRDLVGPASSLPPGIRKNLARGKPLPPGLADRLDGRLLDRLPRYEGYEWKRVGTDLVLVAIATGIVFEILERVLD